MMDCLWITSDQNQIGEINISCYYLLFFTTHVSAPIFFPVVLVILVGPISLSWRRETWKMALGTLLKGLVHLSVCACLRINCKVYSSSDDLAMWFRWMNFAFLGGGWYGCGVEGRDCWLFQWIVAHFPGGVKHSNEALSHSWHCHRRESHQTPPKCVSEVLPLQTNWWCDWRKQRRCSR